MRAASAKRRVGWIASVLAVIGAPFALACAASSPSATPFTDGGIARTDASARDAGFMIPADGAAPDGGPITPGGREELATDAVSCADFRDDGDGLQDCADPDCSGTAICCVESTSAACCAAPTSVAADVDFRAASCAVGMPAASCTSGVTGFGTSASAFVDDVDELGSLCADGVGAMAPQGGARSDAGLLFDQSHDTGSAAVAIEAHVGVGSAAAGSIDAIAVGLTSQTDLGATARVRPIVAIVVSATDQTIRAVAGDVSFDAISLTDVFGTGGCHELDVRLETSPDGTFDAAFRRHDESGSEFWTPLETGQRFQPTPLSHPVIYGRTTNPGIEGVHAWIRSFGVDASVCDVLAPSRSTSTVFAGATPAANVRSASRLGNLAAYEIDGIVYAAGVDGMGRIDPAAAAALPALIDPALQPESFFGAGAFDPELAQVGVNVRLYFTGLSPEGVRSIGYVDLASDLAARVTGSTPRQLFDPSIVGIVGADGPTYLETMDATGTPRRLLVFRAISSDAGQRRTDIRALELLGGDAVLGLEAEAVDAFDGDSAATGFYSRSSPLSPGATLYASASGDDTAFDRDEVAQPELVVYHGVFRIFYAARRGARWSIGMLRSPDFQHFDLASSTPILSGSGSGFDSVSVSDPDVFVEGEQLSLYYSGSNGVETRPGLATQAIPTP